MSTVIDQFSHKRLLRDLSTYIKNEESYPYVKVRPLEGNIYEWHGNITPINTYYDGFIIHFIMKFPYDYPTSPPKIDLCSGILHSNIIPNHNGYKYFLCLDLINNFFWMEDNRDKDRPFSGWSSSYTVEHIITQLYSFLFDETVENYDGNIKQTIYQLPPELGGGEREYDEMPKLIEKYEKEAKEFVCSVCDHSHDKPYPPVKPIDSSNRKTDFKSDVIKFHNIENKSLQYKNTSSNTIIKFINDDNNLKRFYSTLHNHYKNDDKFDKLVYTLESHKINWKLELPYYFDKATVNNNIYCQTVNPKFFTYINNKINAELDSFHYRKFIKQCVQDQLEGPILVEIFNDIDNVDQFLEDNELLYEDLIDTFTDSIINFEYQKDNEYTIFNKWNELLNKFDKGKISDYYSLMLKKWINGKYTYGSYYVTGCTCEYCVNSKNGSIDHTNITNNIIGNVLDIFFYYSWLSIFYNYHIISNTPHFTKHIDLESIKINNKMFTKYIIHQIFNKDNYFGN